MADPYADPVEVAGAGATLVPLGEMLPRDHPLRDLAGVMITPHLAGSLGTEILRLTDLTLDELARWLAAEPVRTEVTPASLTLHA